MGEAQIVFEAVDVRRPVFLDLVRPATLAPVLVVACLFGWLGAGRVVLGADFLRLALAGALLVACNGISNIWNQLSDMLEDAAHPVKSERPIVSGIVSPAGAYSATVLASFVVILVGALFLPPTFVVLTVLILCFAWAYSSPPKLKTRFPWGAMAVATPRGALGIMAAWSVFGSVTSPELVSVLLVTVPFVFLAGQSKDIDDRESDAVGGVQTVATLWGEGACRAVVLAGFMVPFAVVVLAQLWRADLYLALTAVPAVVGIVGWNRWTGKRLWNAYYACLGLIALAFFLSVL